MTLADAPSDTSVLVGVGVGRGAAVGPVALVRPAPAPTADAPVLRGGVEVGRDQWADAAQDAFTAVADGLLEQA
ncbi:MAG TPA: hypothetical protein VGC57_10235, partial [Cellulomonas sp.]